MAENSPRTGLSKIVKAAMGAGFLAAVGILSLYRLPGSRLSHVWAAQNGDLFFNFADFGSVQSEMRMLAAALESYHADYGSYPPQRPLLEAVRRPKDIAAKGGSKFSTFVPGPLTTPISYAEQGGTPDFPLRPDYCLPRYLGAPYAYETDGQRYLLISAGPNGRYELTDTTGLFRASEEATMAALVPYQYDPTNGARSAGDIIRYGPARPHDAAARK